MLHPMLLEPSFGEHLRSCRHWRMGSAALFSHQKQMCTAMPWLAMKSWQGAFHFRESSFQITWFCLARDPNYLHIWIQRWKTLSAGTGTSDLTCGRLSMKSLENWKSFIENLSQVLNLCPGLLMASLILRRVLLILLELRRRLVWWSWRSFLRHLWWNTTKQTSSLVLKLLRTWSSSKPNWFVIL